LIGSSLHQLSANASVNSLVRSVVLLCLMSISNDVVSLLVERIWDSSALSHPRIELLKLKGFTPRINAGTTARMEEEVVDLETYLKEAGVWHRFADKPETIHTADASRATGIELSRITKNLVCKTSDGHYALLVVPGNRRVNLQRAAQVLNTRNIQLLGFNEAEAISGYPPGGTPSVNHKTAMSVVIEKDLLGNETIFCGGGSRDRILELRTEDVLRLTHAVAADISDK